MLLIFSVDFNLNFRKFKVSSQLNPLYIQFGHLFIECTFYHICYITVPGDVIVIKMTSKLMHINKPIGLRS